MPEKIKEGRRSGVTLIYDTGERDDDALERLQWVLPAAFLGAVAVLFFAVMEWFRPHLPMVLYGLGVMAPMAVILLWRMGLGRWRKAGLALLMVGSFGVPLTAWNAGLYRASVLKVVHELTPMDLSLKASEDHSDRVAAMACERLVASQELGKMQRARDILEDRPDMAIRCLDGLAQEGGGAVVRLARHLHVHWYRGWMEEESKFDEEVGCEAARRYREVGRLYGDAGTPQLLSCALGSENEPFARCCGTALSEVDEPAVELAPERWIHELEEPLFVLLIDAADVPAHRLLADEPVVETVPWAPRELFHWKTQLGCHLTQEKSHSEPIARQLSRTIETQCGLEIDDPLYSQAGVRFVERTCEEAVWRREEGRTVDVVQWCEAARTANRETVVDTAKFLVHRAHRTYGVEALEEGIVRGDTLLNLMTDERSRFALDDRGRIRPVDDARIDGVRLGRPQWREHSPESEQRRQAVEETHNERREEARRRLEADGEERTAEELRRQVERAAGEQILEDIERLRRGQ